MNGDAPRDVPPPEEPSPPPIPPEATGAVSPGAPPYVAPHPSQPWQYPPGQWAVPVTAPQPRKEQGLAVAALVCGIASVTVAIMVGVLAGPAAVVLGIKARGQVKRDPERYGGAGLAAGGIATGALGVLAGAAYLAFMISFFGSGGPFGGIFEMAKPPRVVHADVGQWRRIGDVRARAESWRVLSETVAPGGESPPGGADVEVVLEARNLSGTEVEIDSSDLVVTDDTGEEAEPEDAATLTLRPGRTITRRLHYRIGGTPDVFEVCSAALGERTTCLDVELGRR